MSNASSEPPSKPSTSKYKFWQSRKNLKRFPAPWLVVLQTIAIFFISQLVAAFIVETGLAIIHHGGNTPGLSSLLDASAPAEFFYIFFAEGLAVWLVLRVVRGRGLNLASIGLGRRPKWRDLKRALLGFGAFYGLLILAGIILTVFFPDFNTNQTQDVGFNHLANPLDGLLAFVSLVILPPLGEEPLVRGYLYSGLRSRWRFAPAMILTSLIFAAAHLQSGDTAALVWGAGIDTFILSVVLVYLREKTGALYAGMLVHGLNNVIAFGVHFHGLLLLR